MTDWVKAIAAVGCMVAWMERAAAQDVLYGVVANADVVRYDTATGECTIISSTPGIAIGRTATNSMAKDASERLLAGSSSRLYEVLPTGLVEYENLYLNDIRATAFVPGSDTILYVTTRNQTRTDLWRVDITIPRFPVKTLVGNQSVSFLGLAFAPNGTLYGWSNNIGLAVIDTLTGAHIDVNPAVSGPARLQSISFDSNGTLWGAQDELYTVDPATGVQTRVGTGMCIDVRGIEFSAGLCYPDCDTSTGVGTLDIFDFLCFQDSFVNAQVYACNCDVTSGPGVCDIFDFLCFQNAFVSGCQ